MTSLREDSDFKSARKQFVALKALLITSLLVTVCVDVSIFLIIPLPFAKLCEVDERIRVLKGLISPADERT